MCRIGLLAFEDTVPQPLRLAATKRAVENSWNLGNKDGCGIATWKAGGAPVVARALDPNALALPEVVGEYVLFHARTATGSPKTVENAHPFELDEAALVHNGHVNDVMNMPIAVREAREKVCKSACDSERLLATYVLNGRNVIEAISRHYGTLNTLLYDSKKNVLHAYPQSGRFNLYTQRGITALAQQSEQLDGIIYGGLRTPVGLDTLTSDKVYSFDLSHPFLDAIEAAEPMDAPAKYHYPYALTASTHAPAAGVNVYDKDFVSYRRAKTTGILNRWDTALHCWVACSEDEQRDLDLAMAKDISDLARITPNLYDQDVEGYLRTLNLDELKTIQRISSKAINGRKYAK